MHRVAQLEEKGETTHAAILQIRVQCARAAEVLQIPRILRSSFAEIRQSWSTLSQELAELPHSQQHAVTTVRATELLSAANYCGWARAVWPVPGLGDEDVW
eukprot:11768811-Alexandrium_andersonii.AAC.1